MEAELATIASHQDGLVTRHQARAHLTIKQLKGRLASGRFIAVRRGVYRFAGAQPGRWHDLRAACLADGPGAVASHRAAAELWAMWGFHDERPELTVPAPMWPRLPGVRAHQSSRLPASHLTQRSGIPVTTAARTIADLSGALTPGFIARLVDDGLRRRIVELTELRAVHEHLVGAGPSLASLEAALDARKPGYLPGDSRAELDLNRLLVDAGLPAPIPQHQVATGGTVYLLDFAYPDVLLGIEYDGWEVHSGRSAFDRDRTRGNALAAAGWTILHFTSGMAADRLQGAALAAYSRVARAKGPSEGQLRESVTG
ncbi:MAG: hypothetical protein DLM54_08865 [Acidimicrobiales bacterium]|nr:MAG: hypothetical protein DLM54_08865 [Acidimicrobiales bacterium]